jgi:hypothetical protein
MKALDLARLTSALEKWVGKGEIRAVLARRDAMRTIIDKLIADRSEADVLIR